MRRSWVGPRNEDSANRLASEPVGEAGRGNLGAVAGDEGALGGRSPEQAS